MTLTNRKGNVSKQDEAEPVNLTGPYTIYFS
jgi:hypothetical protein